MANLDIAVMVRAVDMFSAPVRAMQGALRGLGTGGQSLVAAGAQMGVAAAMAGTAPAGLAGSLRPFIDTAAEWQHQLTAVGTVAGVQGAALTQMGERIQAAARNANQLPDAMLGAYGVLVGAGMQAQTAMAGLPSLGKVATATSADIKDLAATAVVLRDTMNIAPEDWGDTFDMLAQAGKEGGFELKDMAKWLPQLGAMAKTLGMEGKAGAVRLAAMLQIARKGAGSTDEAANNLVNFLGKLSSPDSIKDFQKLGINMEAEIKAAQAKGLNAVEHMVAVIAAKTGAKELTEGAARLGIDLVAELDKARAQGGDAMQRLLADLAAKTGAAPDVFALGTLFQDRQAMSFLLPMLQHTKMYQEIRDKSEGASGVVQADWLTMTATYTEQMKGLVIATTNLRQSVGAIILPDLTQMARQAGVLVDRLRGLAQQHPGLVRMVMAIGGMTVGALAVSGAVLAAVSTGATIIGMAATAAALLAPVIVPLMGLAAAILLVQRHWGALSGFFTAALTAFKSAIEPVSADLAALGAVLSAALAPVARLFDRLRAGMAGLFKGGGGGNGAAALGQSLGTALGQAVAGMVPGLQAAVAGVTAWLAGSGAAIPQTLAAGVRSAAGAVAAAVHEALQRVRNLLPFSDAKEGPLSDLTASGAAIPETLAAGVRSAVGAVAEAVRAVLAGARTVIGAWQPDRVLVMRAAWDLARQRVALFGGTLRGQLGPAMQQAWRDASRFETRLWSVGQALVSVLGPALRAAVSAVTTGLSAGGGGGNTAMLIARFILGPRGRLIAALVAALGAATGIAPAAENAGGTIMSALGAGLAGLAGGPLSVMASVIGSLVSAVAGVELPGVAWPALALPGWLVTGWTQAGEALNGVWQSVSAWLGGFFLGAGLAASSFADAIREIWAAIRRFGGGLWESMIVGPATTTAEALEAVRAQGYFVARTLLTMANVAGSVIGGTFRAITTTLETLGWVITRAVEGWTNLTRALGFATEVDTTANALAEAGDQASYLGTGLGVLVGGMLVLGPLGALVGALSGPIRMLATGAGGVAAAGKALLGAGRAAGTMAQAAATGQGRIGAFFSALRSGAGAALAPVGALGRGVAGTAGAVGRGLAAGAGSAAGGLGRAVGSLRSIPGLAVQAGSTLAQMWAPNRSLIMREAWETARARVRLFGGTVQSQLGPAMRQAWSNSGRLESRIYNLGRALVVTAASALTRFASTVVASVIPAIQSMTAVMMANPVVAIVAAIVAAVALLAAMIYKYWGPLTTWLGAFWSGLTEAWNSAVPVLDAVREAMGPLAWVADLVAGAFQALSDAVAWIGDLFAPVKMSAEDATSVAESGRRIGTAVGAVLRDVAASGQAILTTLADGITAAAMAPYNAVVWALERIRNLLPFSDAREGPLSALTASGSALVNTIAEGITAAAGAVLNAITAVLDPVVAAVQQAMTWIGQQISGVLDAIGGVGSAASNAAAFVTDNQATRWVGSWFGGGGETPAAAVAAAPPAPQLSRQVAAAAPPGESGGAGAPVNLTVTNQFTIQVAGPISPEALAQLDTWLRQKGQIIAEMVQREMRVSGRTDYARAAV